MRSPFVRRAVLTASVVSLGLLATACSSGGSGDKADAKPSAGAGATWAGCSFPVM